MNLGEREEIPSASGSAPRSSHPSSPLEARACYSLSRSCVFSFQLVAEGRGSSGRPDPGSEIVKDPVPEGAGPLQFPRSEGEAEPPRERTLVNGDLAPPRSIVVGEVVIGMGAPCLADEVDGWFACCLAHDAGSFPVEKHPEPRPS